MPLYEPMRAVRTERWKYIKRYDQRTVPSCPNCDDGESKSLWLRHGWKEARVPEESLFDLSSIRTRRTILSPTRNTRQFLQEMRGRLERWMRETNDPLLLGPSACRKGRSLMIRMEFRR